MRAFLQSQSCLKSSRIFAVIFGLLSVHPLLMDQSCRGDELSPSLSPVNPVFPGSVQWIAGPAKVSLGTLADIEVPGGYRFTDASGARAFLAQMRNPVPQGLAGILLPDSGSCMVILKFNEIGYVKDADKDQIDAGAVLKTAWNQVKGQNENRVTQGLAPIASLDWELEPVFDPQEHMLEWAFRAKTQLEGVVNHTVRLLGRHGVLDAIAVQPYRSASDLIPLKELMKNVSFQQGERYADYQNGDKICSIDLASLIIGEKIPDENKTLLARFRGKTAIRVGSALLIGCVAIGSGVLLRKRIRRKKMRAALQSGELQSPARPSKNGFGAAQPAGRPSNGHLSRGKRTFNYEKFYSSMILQLSGYKSEVENSIINGYSHDSGKPAVRQPKYEEVSNQAVVSAHSQLIANQKKLIEEQQWLIREQTKLIEEKTKFMEEKSQLLEKQSELDGNDIYQKTLSFLK